MHILLDTHLVIDLLRGLEPRRAGLSELLGTRFYVSVATLWEISIKTRLHKLDPGVPLQALETAIEKSGLQIIPVSVQHVITGLDHEPPTKDPFDRLLLAICQVEGMKLATVDRALVGHPLALDTSPHFP